MLTIILAACSKPDNLSNYRLENGLEFVASQGFGPRIPGAVAQDIWWITSTNAQIQVLNTEKLKFSNSVNVLIEVAPTPCGDAIIEINKIVYQVKTHTQIPYNLKIYKNEKAIIEIMALSQFCQPRQENRSLYAFISGIRITNGDSEGQSK
jgi:hypothetical protein